MHRVWLTLLDILAAIQGLWSGETGSFTNPTDITVSSTSGQILAANVSRVAFMIQNTGSANVRVGIGITPTATRGFQLTPGQILTMEPPFQITSAVNAIREGGSDSSVSVGEVTSA